MSHTKKSHHSKKHNKTIKHNNKMIGNGKVLKFIQNTMNYLATIKMYHWTTDSFAAHKATDALYGNLQTFMDSYVETSLGNNDNKQILRNKISSIKVKHINSNSALHKYTNQYKNELNQLRRSLSDKKQSNLLNILDEILAELDVLLYLLTLQ